MHKRLCTLFVVSAFATAAWQPAFGMVTLLGKGVIPGNATDQSGLTGPLEDGVTPRNRIGGLGSAIAYTGHKDRYIAVPDRGPADGATTYTDRLYILDIELKQLGPNQYSVAPEVKRTRLLKNRAGEFFTGSIAAFDATGSTESLRLDPEGVRLDRCGESVYISDEYGPYLYEFGIGNGKRRRALNVPNKFLIDFPSATPSQELSLNAFGRQANRGMEGLAISPDGAKLYGIMQSPLIQDGGLDADNSRVGVNSRIVEINVATGAVREFLYVLDDRRYGVSEILAVNGHELLVLERDGNAGTDAAFKKIFKIDLTGATDIRNVKQLPTSDGLPAGVTSVAKSPFIDLLAFGIAGESAPEKFEGLAFGPDLPDGRHLLIVTVDNDFFENRDNLFYAFAIDRADLNFVPQQFDANSRECRDRDRDRDE